YLYYQKTMQHQAINLVSQKMAAALALEGEFSEDGLAAMAGNDNMQMALAKSMAEKIDEADMQRSWAKIKSVEKKKPKPKRVGEGLTALNPDPKPSPLDKLPVEAQLMTTTILERQGKPVPVEAEADIAALAARFAQADAGVWAAARALAEGHEPEPVV